VDSLPGITVLRLGERPARDQRINTHLALVARAFGAERLIMFYRDNSLLGSVEGVNERFGGNFTVEVRERGGWRRFLMAWNGVVVHLTMYGLPLEEGIKRLKAIEDNREILVVIGGEKVPPDVYQRADLNIAVGNQPHSEVAALAVFLDRYLEGKELQKEMKDWQYQIVPQEKGKKVVSREENLTAV